MALGKDRHASLGSHGCEASHSVRRKSLLSEIFPFGHKIPGRVVTQTFLGHFPWHRFGKQNALVVVAGRAISLKTLAGKRSGGMFTYVYFIALLGAHLAQVTEKALAVSKKMVDLFGALARATKPHDTRF